MSVQLDMKVTELLCSRLCHDLVGPVGAINNGIELLEDFEPSMLSDILPLLTTSARQAWRRLDFFRVAFGFGGGRAGWPIADLRKFTAGFLEQGKVSLDWPGDPVGDLAEMEGRSGKLLLNLILLASEALPRGGTVTVLIARSGTGRSLTVTADGTGAALHERVQATLDGDAALDPRTVQAYFTTSLAQDLGTSVATQRSPDRLTLSTLVPLQL